ncbi:MAG: DUF3987 domain-containing protein [Pseudomonadales bacterium]
MDIADRMQCPPDFLLLVRWSRFRQLLVGATALTKRKDDGFVIPNLWGAVVGRPGVMKSPAWFEVLRPLDLKWKDCAEEYQNAKEKLMPTKNYKKSSTALEAKRRRKLKNGNKDAALKELQSDDGMCSTPVSWCRYKITDATVDSFG